MRSDDVYSFLVLRDPETQAGGTEPNGDRDARVVPAYADADETNSEFAATVTTRMADGDLNGAMVAANTFLENRSAADRRRSASAIRAGVALARTLRACARIDDDSRRAWTELEHIDGLGIDAAVVPFEQIDIFVERLNDWRDDLADLLFAATLAGDSDIDRTASCACICAAEAIRRLVGARQNRAGTLPWQAAALQEIVTLPYWEQGAVDEAVGAGIRGAFMARLENLPANRPSAAQLLRQKAIRRYVGDLIILDQQLRKYELGEIAHVENVLLREMYERKHRDLKRVELRVSTETETETISEQDLQTTDRDELRSELNNAVREDIRFGAQVSATVSGKTPNGQYAVGVGGAFSYDRSTDQREQHAHAHATEVIDRARNQITERTRSTRSTTTTTEDEDTTTHGFDNREGDEHVVGVYRWIEKHYDLHLINYGRRLFYEIVLPEPAAYWRAVSARRTLAAAGPLPTKPALQRNNQDPEPLNASHLALRNAGNQLLDFPSRWDEIVQLAAMWGVELGRPPSAMQQVNFELSVPPLTEDKREDGLHAFDDGQAGFFYHSDVPRTVTPERVLKIPDGYEAFSGEVAFSGWMTVGKSRREVPRGSPFSSYYQFERGEATLQVGGRQETFGFGGNAVGPEMRSMADIFPDALHTLTGEIPVALTTVLNGAVCSCRLSCRRLPAAETVWISQTLDLFETAYAERVAQHAAAARQSEIDQRQQDFVRTDATYRAIERRELKRQIIDLLTAGTLDTVGDSVVSPTRADMGQRVEPGAINGLRLPTYTRLVNFFEQAFDWTNLVYIFAPYFYGRSDDWEAGALADESDPQFTAFLSAGAVRVQVPAQLGFEPYVEAFFNGLFPGDPTASVPWLPTGRPIALDLAAAARGGFELWPGRISVPANSATATVSGSTFSVGADTNRELRINGRIFRILEVVNATTLRLDRVVGPQAVDREEYERGGVVIGPPIPLTLPSTLVAIDKEDLVLPQFPGRYA